VNSLAQDCLIHLNEETTHTDAYSLATPSVDAALNDLLGEFSASFIDQDVLKMAQQKSAVHVRNREAIYQNTVCKFFPLTHIQLSSIATDVKVSSLLRLALRPTTHVSIQRRGGGGMSFLITIQVAIFANGCAIFVWFAAQGRRNFSRSGTILFGSNDKPSTYDPCDCAKVRRYCPIGHKLMFE